MSESLVGSVPRIVNFVIVTMSATPRPDRLLAAALDIEGGEEELGLEKADRETWGNLLHWTLHNGYGSAAMGLQKNSM